MFGIIFFKKELIILYSSFTFKRHFPFGSEYYDSLEDDPLSIRHDLNNKMFIF